jgi:hypothetical protein
MIAAGVRNASDPFAVGQPAGETVSVRGSQSKSEPGT